MSNGSSGRVDYRVGVSRQNTYCTRESLSRLLYRLSGLSSMPRDCELVDGLQKDHGNPKMITMPLYDGKVNEQVNTFAVEFHDGTKFKIDAMHMPYHNTPAFWLVNDCTPKSYDEFMKEFYDDE